MGQKAMIGFVIVIIARATKRLARVTKKDQQCYLSSYRDANSQKKYMSRNKKCDYSSMDKYQKRIPYCCKHQMHD